MPTISAQTCITNTGTTTLGGIFTIYTANTGPFDVFQTNVPISSLTPPNCPYIMEVDSSTTQIRFVDDLTNCFIDMNIQNSDLCQTCDLDLSLIQTNPIGRISVGVLTGSCQNPISSYSINWYGPNSTTNLAFTSGSGNTFSYQYPHPLTGVSSIPVEEGTYYPVIQNVVLSGLTFSITGGPSNIISCLDCLDPINVDCYSCDNVTNTNSIYPYSGYNHYIEFNTSLQGTPVPVTITFCISASTNYFVWKFQGDNAPDKIKISLSGQNYNTLIGLEDIWVGQLLPNNQFTPSSFPKSALTNTFYSKITTLTSLNVADGDKLIIEILPSITNTNWFFYFSCLETFECENCITNNDYYKIIESTITSTVNACDDNFVNFKVSGCTYDEFYNNDYSQYYANPFFYGSTLGTFPFSAIFPQEYSRGIQPDISNQISTFDTSPNLLYYPRFTCNIFGNTINNLNCKEVGQPTIYKVENSPSGNAIYSVTGDSATISLFYQQWQLYANTTASPLTSDYYQITLIIFPTNTTPNFCADPTNYTFYSLHPSFNIVTGNSGSDYFLSISSTTITNQLSFSSCDTGCNQVQNLVNNINNSTTGSTSLNYSSSLGFMFENFVRQNSFLSTGITQSLSIDKRGYHFILDSETNTYPFSGSPEVLIPDLSASCCTTLYDGGDVTSYFGSLNRLRYNYYYRVSLTNPSDVSDFNISAGTITNGFFNGTFTLIYSKVGGIVTYSDPTYII